MTQTACKDCGVIIDIISLNKNSQYSCPCCHSTIYSYGEDLNLVLVMAISALVFFIPTLFLPIMSLEIFGNLHSVNLLEAVLYFANDGYVLIAIIATSTGVLIPILLLILILMMISSLKMGHKPYSIRYLFRFYKHLTTWAMAEVYLISIFVAIIKLQGMATLTINLGLISFMFFLMSFYITIIWFNADDIWEYE